MSVDVAQIKQSLFKYTMQYIICQRMFEITENSASHLLLSVDPDVHAVKVTFEDLQQLNHH